MSQPDKNLFPEHGPYAPGEVAPPKSKSGWGCCLFGCLFTFLFMLLLGVGAGVGGYWWLQGQVQRWTSDTPGNLPVVEYSEDQVQEIKDRVEVFRTAVDEGQTPDELVLTAEEINALISSDEDLKGRVFVRIEEGQIAGDLSIPTDFLPGGRDRYFNASATFHASLENGVLIVTLVDAEVQGEQVPAHFIEGMSRENLAKDAYKDPEFAETLRKFESLRVEDDRIVLTPRRQTAADEAAPGGDEPGEPAADDAAPEKAVPEAEEAAADRAGTQG